LTTGIAKSAKDIYSYIQEEYPTMLEKLSHSQVWTALDALAERYALTASALARKAGLDATTFNRSKRQTAGGHLRWPSTESIAKVLEATGASLDEFTALLAPNRSGGARHPRPLIGLTRAGAGNFFDDKGVPTGSAWDEIDLFADVDEHSYALEVSGEAMAPFYDLPVILPISGRRSKSITVGIRCMGAVFDGTTLSSVSPVGLFTSRRRPA